MGTDSPLPPAGTPLSAINAAKTWFRQFALLPANSNAGIA